MSIKDVLQKSFVEGYSSMNLTISDMVVCLLCTAAIAIYIFLVYKGINKNSFYNKNFNNSIIKKYFLKYFSLYFILYFPYILFFI